MSVGTQLSKEFQIKLRKDVVPWDQAARDRLMEILASVEASRRFDFEIVDPGSAPIERRGERYDTLPDIGVFRRQGISLASEKTGGDSGGGHTKLKCKLHSLVPELLYRKPKKSWCWPRPPRDDVQARFKLEQDIHFDNTKFCATGYMTLPGHGYELSRVGDFFPYFPRLAELEGVRAERLLVKVKDWDEVVFEDMAFRIGDLDLRGALVSRYRRESGEWDETEFAFKLKRDLEEDAEGGCSDFLRPADGWHYKGLRQLGALYNELFALSSVFIQLPSIFYFADPVSSRDIGPA